MIHSLGQDKWDAINWAQDRFGLLRFVAEELVIDSIKTGKIIITENGVFLTEAEEDFDENVKNKSNHIMKRRTFAKDHNRIKNIKKLANKMTHKDSNSMSSTNNGDDAAFDMINGFSDDDEDNQ